MRVLLNQKGLSSILFAMIFATVLSLLAIGFATLARNDQRQVLDQSLGYQAQYAAETAVNQVKAELQASPTGALSPTTKSTCDSANIKVKTGSGVDVTCVTWSDESDTIKTGVIDTSPKAYRLHTTGGGSLSKLVFTWGNEDGTAAGKYTSADGLPDDIGASNYPILRIAVYGSDGFKKYYSIPTDSSTNLNYNSSASGLTAAADCSTGDECTFTLTGANRLENGYISISTLGGATNNVTISTDSGRRFTGVQYTIDVTAIAQDVTKRVEARVPVGPTSWKPKYSVSAGRMCKDLKIDGTNTQGISGDPTCAGRL